MKTFKVFYRTVARSLYVVSVFGISCTWYKLSCVIWSESNIPDIIMACQNWFLLGPMSKNCASQLSREYTEFKDNPVINRPLQYKMRKVNKP